MNIHTDTDAGMDSSVGVYIIGRNCQETLATALDSVYSQSRPVDLVVYVDDGSSDASLKIAGRYIDRGLVVLSNPVSLGIPAARNRGARACGTRWIAVLDSDDCWHRDKMARQMDYLRAHPDTGLLGTFARVTDGSADVLGVITAPVRDTDVKQAELIRNCFIHSSVLFSRELFERVGGYAELAAAEDYDLMLKLSEHAPVANIPEPLADYRISAGSASVSQRRILRRCAALARDGAYRRRGLEAATGAKLLAAAHQAFLALVLFDARIHWGVHQMLCGDPSLGRRLLRRARAGGLRHRIVATGLLAIPDVVYRKLAGTPSAA